MHVSMYTSVCVSVDRKKRFYTNGIIVDLQWLFYFILCVQVGFKKPFYQPSNKMDQLSLDFYLFFKKGRILIRLVIWKKFR